LKGVEFLESAVAELNSSTHPLPTPPLLKIVSNAFGEELEKVWAWCDVLVLPTLSENFGRVVAEALERGKRVITTDGAPVWGDGNDYDGRLVYLRGFRDGTDEVRIRLLKDALAQFVG
jgi:glycosyltransferase involved in cell wall biosynthesis